jgi:hypothetical protein
MRDALTAAWGAAEVAKAAADVEAAAAAARRAAAEAQLARSERPVGAPSAASPAASPAVGGSVNGDDTAVASATETYEYVTREFAIPNLRGSGICPSADETLEQRRHRALVRGRAEQQAQERRETIIDRITTGAEVRAPFLHLEANERRVRERLEYAHLAAMRRVILRELAALGGALGRSSAGGSDGGNPDESGFGATPMYASSSTHRRRTAGGPDRVAAERVGGEPLTSAPPLTTHADPSRLRCPWPGCVTQFTAFVSCVSHAQRVCHYRPGGPHARSQPPSTETVEAAIVTANARLGATKAEIEAALWDHFDRKQHEQAQSQRLGGGGALTASGHHAAAAAAAGGYTGGDAGSPRQQTAPRMPVIGGGSGGRGGDGGGGVGTATGTSSGTSSQEVSIQLHSPNRSQSRAQTPGVGALAGASYGGGRVTLGPPLSGHSPFPGTPSGAVAATAPTVFTPPMRSPVSMPYPYGG